MDGQEVASASLERILVQEGMVARRLAQGLAYFNAPDLPDQLIEIPPEYLEMYLR